MSPYKLLFIFILACLPFLSGMHNPFVSDDWDFLYIAETREQPVHAFFTTNYYGTRDGGTYRPMVNVFWFGMYGLFETSPMPYHLATIAFHGLNAVLLFLLVTRSGFFGKKERQKIAWIATLLFVFLPNHSEAVNWISVINDTMMTTFYLLSLYFFVLASREKKQRRYGWYVLSLVCFGISLLTKEMALTLPFVLLVGISIRARISRTSWRAYLRQTLCSVPYIVLIGVYAIVRHGATGLFAQTYVGDLSFHPFFLWRSYISITVSTLLSGEVRNAVTWWVYSHRDIFVGFVILTVFGLVALVRSNKKKGWIILGLLASYIISIIPVFQYGVDFVHHRVSEEGERYAYLPSVFFVALVAALAHLLYTRARRYRFALRSAFFIVLIFLGVQLHEKNQVWAHAASVSDRLLHEYVAVQSTRGADGNVIVGMPDSFSGAFIFRNAFDRAVAVASSHAISPKNILVTKNRVIYDPRVSFEVSRNGHTFNYRETQGRSVIAAPGIYNGHDYTGSLGTTTTEPYSIGYVLFSDEYTLTFEDVFVDSNKEKIIDVYAFDGKSWHAERL
jgi:protein O-mannosyl-transferase